MRSRVTVFIFIALLTGEARALAAQDAGGTTGDDAAAGDDGGAVQDAGSGDDGSSVGDAQPIIACDGDLCDTLQGRPTCAVSASAAGRGEAPSAWVLGSVMALALCAGRRARSGASRPGEGGCL